MTESLPPVVEPTPVVKDQSGMAIASLVLGILSLCAWLLPIAVVSSPSQALFWVSWDEIIKEEHGHCWYRHGAIGIILTLINAVAGAILTPMLGGFDVNNMINQYVP